ncbi:hypothetical protein FG379_003662 [Cryptosporidium bovis]|uniref:uncharacterized protein n=1 Tax=Cryptosporidium bovis TaxID=310047 RepID=UPI00351A3745|nr:hypothetical protein FG379_003662 [Cryptosporidium bovis]
MNKGVEQELSAEREEGKNVINLNKKQESGNTANSYDRIKSIGNSSYNLKYKDIVSLKELCNLLISSFCGILEELGLETQEDEELLLIAIESGDTDTVREYVRLLRNKLSSVLLLRNIDNSVVGNNQVNYIEYTSLNGNSGANESYLSKDENLTKQKIPIIGETSPERYFPPNNDLNDNIVEYDSHVFNGDNSLSDNFIDSNSDDQPSMNIKSNHKKSPVPPLRVEFAGPGSWNRCQIPNEYPSD